MGTGLTGVLLYLFTGLFGISRLWLLLTLVALFLFAAYFAWREEYLKASRDEFRSQITGMVALPFETSAKTIAYHIFVSLRISNLGPPVSVHTWQAGYLTANGGRTWLVHGLLYEGERDGRPADVRGKNLRDDHAILATGESREGWIGFDADSSQENVLRGISLLFTDAFENHHDVSSHFSATEKRR